MRIRVKEFDLSSKDLPAKCRKKACLFIFFSEKKGMGSVTAALVNFN